MRNRPTLPRRGALFVALLLASLSWLAPPGMDGAGEVGAGEVGEYDLKAAFLYNFLKFVEWPSSAPGPLRICVYGDDPFGAALGGLTGKSAKGRAIVLEHLTDLEQAATCRVLFISDSEAPRLERILADLEGTDVLTVGDSRGFARSGGMIGFVEWANRLRIEINRQATDDAGLRLSAQLQEIALRIYPPRRDRAAGD